MRRFLIVPALVLASVSVASNAQTVPPFDTIKTEAELTHAVTELDKQLFDAYNTCNLEKFNSFFTEDTEFYHDQGGVTLGNKALTESIKKNICGTTQRVLVPGTLQVYPMKGYGAVEMGVHRFMHPWKQDHGVVGEGKFIMLWQYKDGAWKITRTISYDHHLAK